MGLKACTTSKLTSLEEAVEGRGGCSYLPVNLQWVLGVLLPCPVLSSLSEDSVSWLPPCSSYTLLCPLQPASLSSHYSTSCGPMGGDGPSHSLIYFLL